MAREADAAEWIAAYLEWSEIDADVVPRSLRAEVSRDDVLLMALRASETLEAHAADMRALSGQARATLR